MAWALMVKDHSVEKSVCAVLLGWFVSVYGKKNYVLALIA